MDRTEENRQEYKELQCRVKREVSKAKQKAYDELYTRLDTREGEKDLYRLARQRDRDGKDVQQVRVIKDRDGRVLTSEESVQRRWKEYFEELMNEENEREKRVEGVNSVEQKVDKIRKDEVRKALKRMKSGKAVGPDDIPVEVWKCLGEAAVEFLASLFNRVLESERMPEEWRRSVLVPIFKNKGDVQSCSNYRGIKLMSHTMKVWERVVEARLRKVVEICEQQYGFMPRKSTTDAIFALRILMEKYRDGQRELHCVFVDLEKAYDRVPREELWYCMRKSGVAEKYVRVVQDMYERSRTVVRCAVGQTEEFKVEVGLHQGSTLSPFLFAIVMDQLSEEVRQESPWTMMFADDIVICSESREQVEKNLERWRFALERRGMKVSRSKTEYMCVNEREGSGTVRLQGEEVKKVQEFKYLGSTVQSNGECGKEVKKRVQAGWNGWRKVWGVLCDRKISARIKGKVYRTVVRPAMLYGLETVSLRKRQESELEVAELKMLRFSLGVTRLDRIRNEYIRGTAHVGRLGDKVREARLRWFGHVQRRESCLIEDDLCEPHEVCINVSLSFRQKLRQTLGGQVLLPDDWETTAEVIRETGRKVLGVSSGRRKEDKETWWRNEEVQDSIQRKRLAKKKWDMDRTEENRQEYKELQRRVKREVSKAKQKAYDELYTSLDTREGEKNLYRLARQRDRDGKDVQQVRAIKDRDGRVLTSEESVQRRWKEYFEELMNEENEREKRVEGVNSVEQKVDKIRKDEVRKALKRMKSGKAVGPDDIPVEVWKCLGEAAVEFLTSLFNRVLENLEKAYDRVPGEELWYCMRKSGVAEKYVRVVQDMYERSRTVVRCAVGQTEEFNVEVGLHQGSALSPFLFAIVMDQLSEEVRQESPWTMMFADDIVICSESREQVEENLERWRFALERRGMKVSRSKTEYMCVNERERSGTVRLQGEEVKKVPEFKYLGSTVQSNGECGKEVKKRVQAGWNGWRKVSGVLCDRKISARIKGKVYRTVVRPAMLYGLETVSLRKRQESELEVAELKMLRFSLGVTRLDRIRNKYIRGTAHVGRLGDKVREARLRWFEHVQRREWKGRELADMMERRKVDILCVQETSWKGSKARSIGAGFKLFYYGVDSKRNGVGCELEEKERFWSELDEVMESIPTGERVVIGADFNGHVGEGNTGDEEVMGKFGVKERNLEGQMVVDFAKRMDMGVVNTCFQKREEHRVTYKSGEEEVKDREETKWWKLKKEECCEEFRQKLRQALGGQVVLPDDWETTAEVIRETGRKVLGVSSGKRKGDKETWWWNEEVQDSVQRKRLAKKKWDMDRTEENRQEYKELQRRVKREVSKAKQKAYDELYTSLDTREGEKDLYRLARQRDRDGKDVQQVRAIKDRDGMVLTSEESVQRRWKEYFEELMNEENEREKRVEGVNSVEQKVDKIRKDEVRKALKRMKSGKAVGPDDIPVEVWKCLGEAAVEFLASLFNRVLESERMPEEWRRSVLVPIFKNKGDVQSCSNYRGIKLMSHTMKLWERVVEARLRKVVEICEQQYGFMPRKSTTDAIFALRVLMEKYRDGQRELHCVCVDLEKAYDRVPGEELWYCMRKSGVAEKYVRVVQDMYERSRTVVRCAVGQTEEFNVEVGLHQGSALSPFLFAIVMDQLSEEVRQESPWTMMFADDIVICSESREQVEENLERWRFALERRGMKVSHSKTEYMCVNEREGSGTVRLQGEEVKKVQEFKYLGSTVQSNGECGKEVKKRVQAGWNGWRKVWGVLCDRKISARIKGKVYRTVVRPAMLYGLETVSLRKRQESELEIAELKMLRFSLGVTRLDRIRNE
ncbi:hypothetical protein QTP86_008947 [Hemibagrus guttatus]|nr:hypothetical protein QTP86_008947 [Hemibagrus guttatus]